MRNILSLIFMVCAITSPLSFADQVAFPGQKRNLEDFKKRYFEKRINSFRNNVAVRVSYYDILLEIDRNSLSDSSRTLLDDILAILEMPEDEELRTRYINNFPATFSEYCRVFPPDNRKELHYSSYVFIEMFEDILKEHPDEYVAHLIGLSVNAKRIADSLSPSYLQNILAEFFCNFYEIFVPPFNELDYSSQQNIVTFICSYEAFPYVKEIDCIIKKLKEKDNQELLKRFLSVKKKSDS